MHIKLIDSYACAISSGLRSSARGALNFDDCYTGARRHQKPVSVSLWELPGWLGLGSFARKGLINE